MSGAPLRLLTLNLQHAAPARGWPGRAGSGPGAPPAAALAEAADQLAAVGADVVLLQEVDRGMTRSGRSDQVAELAARLGLPHHRFAASLAGLGGGMLRPTRSSAPAAGYGVALLSRYPVRSWHVSRLPGMLLRRRAGAPRWRPGGWTTDPARVLLAAVVDAPAGPLCVGVTHLSTAPATARRQLRRCVAALATLPGPRVLGGDLNLDAGDLATTVDLEPLAIAPTFTNAVPRTQLDHLLGDGGLRAVGPAQVHHLRVSDHAGLSVDVELTDAGR